MVGLRSQRPQPPPFRHDHDESYPFGFNPSGVASEVLFASIKKWEEHLKRLLGGTRVAEHDRGIACLRLACRESYCELLLAHLESVPAVKMLNERLWMNWYKEIDPLQAKLRGSLSPTSSHAGESASHVRDAMAAVLATCTAFYNTLLLRLTGAMSTQRERGGVTTLRHSIHMTFVALGDVARYSQNMQPKATRSWRVAENYYHQAQRHNPSNGKVYNQLALLALHQNQTLEAAYYYSRSLACATPFSSRTNLQATLTGVKPPSPAPYTEIKAHCSAHLLHCIARLFTNIDLAKLQFEVPAAIDVWRRSLAQSGHRSFYLQTMSLALFSVHNCQLPLGSMTSSLLTKSDDNRDVLHFYSEWPRWQDHDNINFALQLVFQLTAALADAVTLSPDQQRSYALLPALTLSLDWLRTHPWFLVHACAAELRASMAKLLPHLQVEGLSSDTTPPDEWLGTAPLLWDDVEMRGFLPLANVRRCVQDASSANDDDEPTMRRVRVLGFVSSVAAGLGWNLQPTAPPQPPSFFDGDTLGNLTLSATSTDCPQCSNSIAIDLTACEYCGFDFDGDQVVGEVGGDVSKLPPPNTDVSEFTNDKPVRGGMLSGVNWQVAKPTAHSSKRTSGPPRQHFGSSAPRRPPPQVDFRGSGTAPSDWKCLIVVDAANVAMRHGLNTKFSCRGIRLVFDYYIARGHKAIAFLPDYLLQYESVGAQKRMANVGFDVSPTKLPDDVTLLQAMKQEGLVIATPPQDYDDSYCIQYAGTHDGCLVTNDLFRDHLDNIKPSHKRGAMRDWLKAHRISFTWVGDEFLPNPDFRYGH
ncbi:hypothetical protein B5M09_000563 [Aphanomyces astaci]|uniref:RNase NYN domain-containing protein n=1 Tax=Aphanomyces astaci TaxID=112090 RepID=A0A3R7X758_APHAT|nr:hypothetical protein B5M09_000563 [Aphanomyces astaci]